MRFNNLCGSGSYASISGNDALIEQISYETGAISAETGTGGIRVNLIPKEGGNTLKGSLFLNGSGERLQRNNLIRGPDDVLKGRVGQEGQVGQVGSACGHASSRPRIAAAKRQRRTSRPSPRWPPS